MLASRFHFLVTGASWQDLYNGVNDICGKAPAYETTLPLPLFGKTNPFPSHSPSKNAATARPSCVPISR